MRSHRVLVPAACLALVAGCGAAEPTAAGGEGGAEATPHGYVEGAQEVSEPQLQLAALDAAGRVVVTDLLTGEATEVAELGPVGDTATDGRFVAAVSEPPGELHLVDTGTWTVDHGDHVHYYRAPARVLTALPWDGGVAIASSETLTALFSPETGAGVVLDRGALGRGEVETLAELSADPHDGALLPLGGRVVATDGEQVVVHERDGTEVDGARASCPAPAGGLVTRVGAVVSCAGGAVLVTEDDGDVTLEQVPYPVEVATGDRASGLAQRAGRPAAAAPAGAQGVWLLDARARSWQLLPTDTPWVHAVAAADEADRIVGMDEQGRVVVLEPESGTVSATEPLVPAELVGEVDLQVDADRAYVNVPGGDSLVEIDYADSARVARTLPAGVDPRHLAETGL